MTNAEKFEEVFGFEPDVDFTPFECPEPYASDKCEYFEELDGGCNCNMWWYEEYKKKSKSLVTLRISQQHFSLK